METDVQYQKSDMSLKNFSKPIIYLNHFLLLTEQRIIVHLNLQPHIIDHLPIIV